MKYTLFILFTGTFLYCAISLASSPEKLFWKESFDGNKRWSFRPKWCKDPAKKYDFSQVSGNGCFTFSANSQIKSLTVIKPKVEIPAGTILEIRYKGTNLIAKKGFFIHVVSKGPKKNQGISLINQSQLQLDGKWHTAEVVLKQKIDLSVLVLRLCSGVNEGKMVIDYILFKKSNKISKTAQIPSTIIWEDNFYNKGQWAFRPTWCADPALKYKLSSTNGTGIFTLAEGSNIKVVRAASFNVTPNDYLLIRYRGKELITNDQYLLFVGGSLKGDKGITVFKNSDMSFDGKWHTAVFRFPRKMSVSMLALQFFAKNSSHFLEIDYIKVQNTRPEFTFKSVLGVQGEKLKTFTQFNLTGKYNASINKNLKNYYLLKPPSGNVYFNGVVHNISNKKENAIIIEPRKTTELQCQVSHAKEIFFLGLFDWPQKNGEVIKYPEAFNIKVEFTDNSEDIIFPYSLKSKGFQLDRGLSHYAIPTVKGKTLKNIRIANKLPNGQFYLMSITANSSQHQLIPNYNKLFPQTTVKKKQGVNKTSSPAKYFLKGDYAYISIDGVQVVFKLKPTVKIEKMESWTFEQAPLFKLYDKQLNELKILVKKITPCKDNIKIFGNVADDLNTSWILTISADKKQLNLDLELNNNSSNIKTYSCNFPCLSQFREHDHQNTAIFFPSRIMKITPDNISLSKTYSGSFPFQLLGVFNIQNGGGLFMYTRDLKLCVKDYFLEKNQNGVGMLVKWGNRTIPAQKSIKYNATIGINKGDWKNQLATYRKWLHSKISTPKQADRSWFTECFTLRQHHMRNFVSTKFKKYLLFDEKSQHYRIKQILAQDQEEFGPIDLLHIFDWGTTEPPDGYLPAKTFPGERMDGRVGDYTPYNEIGGLELFKNEIEDIQQQNTRVGLYFEGCLLSKRSKAGKKHALAWAARKKDMTPYAFYAWQNAQFVCRNHPGWQNYLSQTVIRVDDEVHADAYYLDELGFANPSQRCWGHKDLHQHPVSIAQGECTIFEKIRRQIPAKRALYLEEHPGDITAKYADGSLSHDITFHENATYPAISLYRFIIPRFKIFHILGTDVSTHNLLDKYKQVFFNGDGFYLNGPVGKFISPTTAAFVKKAAGIMRKYKNVFSSDDVEPYFPSSAPGIFINRFSSGNTSIFTIFNARFNTYEGELLSLPFSKKITVKDLWGERQIKAVNNKITGRLPLRSVACVIVMKH